MCHFPLHFVALYHLYKTLKTLNEKLQCEQSVSHSLHNLTTMLLITVVSTVVFMVTFEGQWDAGT